MSMTRSEAGRLGAKKTNLLWRQRYAENPKFCEFCTSVMPYEKRHNKFCDHSCAASFNNKGISRNESSLKYKLKNCLYCCEKMTNEKFCSSKCHRDHEWKLRKLLIEETQKEESVRCAKRYLKETRGVRCEICGIEEWCDQPVPLVMDHIDGHSENNQLNNLRLVCGNCDMQLPTYKSKNKGNGRYLRRKRYVEGKSF